MPIKLLPQRALFICLSLSLVSCTTVQRGPIPLSGKQIEKLTSRMKAPAELGLQISPGPTFRSSAARTAGEARVEKIDMLTPGQGGASLRKGMYHVNGALVRIRINGRIHRWQ